MGLWLLQRVLKEQNVTDLPALIADTEQLTPCRIPINPNDERFINPENMSAEIRAACRGSGQPEPEGPAGLARCIFDSLALLYADVLGELAALRGRPFSQLHIARRRLPEPSPQSALRRRLRRHGGRGPHRSPDAGHIGTQLMTLEELDNVDVARS